ncbi:MAG TPA: hypothetical protein VNO14_16385 [Blastocatellia bacterium]|nr:hypothetical protein [Blastocatellia bacterium]
MHQYGSSTQSEHHFKRVVPGDIESVRKRLQEALEAFNYDVVGEQPLQARRVRQKNILTATVLEQNASLTVALKSLSPASTLATFNYLVEMLFTEGDRHTLEREADAIIALATTISSTARCASCGSDNPGHVRFCRVCGTPTLRTTMPAEVEVMRLTDGARTSHQEITLGVLIITVILAISLALILLGGPKAFTAGWWVLAIGEPIGLLTLFSGMRRLHLTLNPKNQQQSARALPPPVGTGTQGLLSNPAAASITEGTTELMDLPERERAPARLKKPERDTDPIE